MKYANPIFMPQLGQTVEESTLVRWLKKEGDQVSEGDIICEVESDKTTMEVPSTITGYLKEIKINEGETVPVGTVLGIVE